MAAAAHAKPNHDYHLVNPSPWPFVGSVSAFVLAIGAIIFFKARKGEPMMLFGADLAGAGPWIMLLGFAGQLALGQTALFGASAMVTEAGRPCHDSSVALTAPMFPMPEPPYSAASVFRISVHRPCCGRPTRYASWVEPEKL